METFSFGFRGKCLQGKTKLRNQNRYFNKPKCLSILETHIVYAKWKIIISLNIIFFFSDTIIDILRL